MSLSGVIVEVYSTKSIDGSNTKGQLFSNGSAQLTLDVYTSVQSQGNEDLVCLEVGLVDSKQVTSISSVPNISTLFKYRGPSAIGLIDTPTTYLPYPNVINSTGPDVPSYSLKNTFNITTGSQIDINKNIDQSLPIMAYAKFQKASTQEIAYVYSNIKTSGTFGGEPFDLNRQQFVDLEAKKKPIILSVMNTAGAVKNDPQNAIENYWGKQFTVNWSPNSFSGVEIHYSNRGEASTYYAADYGIATTSPNEIRLIAARGEKGGINNLWRVTYLPNVDVGNTIQYLNGDDLNIVVTSSESNCVGVLSYFEAKEASIPNDYTDHNFWGSISVEFNDDFGGQSIMTITVPGDEPDTIDDVQFQSMLVRI